MAVTVVALRGLKIKKRNIKNFVRKVLKSLEMKKMDLSIVFVDKNEIQEINRKFRGVDAVTDVMSFYGYEEDYLGDVIICLDMVKENAVNYKEDPNIELGRVIVHGILHLLGYKDYTDEEREVMFKKQEEILISIDLYDFGLK
ncbi:MAG: rRNA maturation RNase YbeY [Thermosulfidibacteraceae bacterium]|jgi:probable rRNA maturation factor